MKNMTLYVDFCAALKDASDVAVNGYLQLLTPYIKDIESASYADYCKKMTAILKIKNFALNGKLVAKFSQLFGEAHFADLCSKQDVLLNKIPEHKNTKTPDFCHCSSQEKLFFEVKTLSVVGGERGINDDLEKALNAQVDIERQLKEGRRVAIGVSEMQPYAEKPYLERSITAVISTLIEKTKQNIKSDQYKNQNTFLVLNLCLIPPAITNNKTLRPVYCDDSMFSKAITGDLWMLAFAKPGMLIHGNPEFEGNPCIEGIIQKFGVLSNPDYADISGLLCVVYPLGSKPYIYGLYRSSDYHKWIDETPEVINILKKLTGKNWNDDYDSNGWQLA